MFWLLELGHDPKVCFLIEMDTGEDDLGVFVYAKADLMVSSFQIPGIERLEALYNSTNAVSKLSHRAFA